jgi:hypothetical protein
MTITAQWLKESYGDIFTDIKQLPRMVIRDFYSGHYTYHKNMGGWETPWHFFTSCLAKYSTHGYESCKILNDRCLIFNQETGEMKQEIWFEY